MSRYQQMKPVYSHPLSYTYKAVNTLGYPVILRVFSSTYVDEYGSRHNLTDQVFPLISDLLRLRTMPPCEGLAPWTDFEVLNEQLMLRFERPFYAYRLRDIFPPDPSNPPSAGLLQAFRELAHGFDFLAQFLPNRFFFLHPNNLLSDGAHAFLADYGLSDLRRATDAAYEGPRSFDAQRVCEAASCYAIDPFRVDYPEREAPRHIQPVFTLASLYVYLRRGYGPFVDASFPQDLARKFTSAMGFWSAHSLMAAYHEHGTVSLSGLSSSEECDVVARALVPASTTASCIDLIDELCAIYGC